MYYIKRVKTGTYLSKLFEDNINKAFGVRTFKDAYSYKTQLVAENIARMFSADFEEEIIVEPKIKD